ncbi:hypothetical protein SAMN02745157_0271 [Kaistia soli DSM 19436]|uniref:Nutrient deprivation-induced protein n=2 Tax=Kaistia TaxID=166953 RepID=A0A1M5PYD1_9HYPH|nr:hypothetical protein SAMN02745157_0271 [Kaistia soli DSM 19436]
MDDRGNIQAPGNDLDGVGGNAANADGVSDAMSAIKREGAEQLAAAKEQAQDVLEKVGDEAKSFAADRKDVASDQLGNVADAIASVADTLEVNTSPMVADYARDLADGLKQASNSVKSRNVDEIVGLVQDFGRQQPLAFLGAAALAGFVASRFMLSSAERTRTGERSGSQAVPTLSTSDPEQRSLERGEV